MNNQMLSVNNIHHNSSPSLNHNYRNGSTKNASRKVNRRGKYRETRFFAVGYNTNFQFGINEKSNHTKLCELPWAKKKCIRQMNGSVSNCSWIGYNGMYYFSGEIDTDYIGMQNRSNSDCKIIKKYPTRWLKNNQYQPEDQQSIANTMQIERIANGVTARHTIIISSFACVL